MSDLTSVLGLVRQHLEDIGDKRVDNINWDIIDKLFHAIDGHKHDGVDSPLIDLDAIWRAIYELRAICAQLRIDLNILDIREWMHYNEYIKHKHYALDTPPSIETHWFETFQDYNQTNINLTTASVTVASSALHLPINYNPNNPYLFVSKPFQLSHTLVENPNPDVQPDKAFARIVMARQGIVTPYIAIGDNLAVNKTSPRYYPEARAGVQTEISFIDQYIKSKVSFEGKVRGEMTVPHVAWHYHEIEEPIMTYSEKRSVIDLGNKVTGRGPKGPKGPKGRRDPTRDGRHGRHGRPGREIIDLGEIEVVEGIWKVDVRSYTDRVEFSTREYNDTAIADNQEVSTVAGFTEANATSNYVNLPQRFRVLYDADRSLAFQKSGKKFFWYNSATGTAEEIQRSLIQPLYEDNLVDIAAAIDPSDDSIWVLKSWLVWVNNPSGYFDLYHQFVKWDGEITFIEGRKWKSSRHKRKHWPANVIVPTKLKIDQNNVYPITVFNPNDLKDEGETLVNYYDGDDTNRDAHDNYTWFPFKKVYGDLHKQRDNVTFINFNPGILGTILTIPKNGDWVGSGSANIIQGAFRPAANKWNIYTQEQINAFEGGNDKVYLGDAGQEIFFYQAFTPYDGSDILTNKRYLNDTFRQSNPDYSWHGIVAYNISTGQNRLIRGNIPMKINTGGAINIEGGDAYLSGGVEMVKQFLTNDDRIISTIDNVNPVGTPIKYAFWVDRNIPGAVTAQRMTLRDEVTNPIKVDLNTGQSSRMPTSSISITPDDNSRMHHPQVVMHTTGISIIGGRYIENRASVRTRSRDRLVQKIRRWSGALKDGSKARQIYNFDIGADRHGQDTIKLYTKSRSEGKVSTQIAAGNIKDVEIFGWIDPNWVSIGNTSNNEGLVEFDITDELFSDRGELTVMLESSRVSDKASGLASKLHTDHIYLAMQKQNYVYEYEWEDLPDGKNGIIILECLGGVDAAGNLTEGDTAGVRVDTAEFSIISNREG